MVLALLAQSYTLDSRNISAALILKNNQYQDEGHDNFLEAEASETGKGLFFPSSLYFPEKSKEPNGVPRLHLADTAGYSAHPSQSYHRQTPSRTMHLWYGGWNTSGIRILDSNATSHLYSIRFQTKNPHMSLESTSTGATVGTATYHSSTSRIDTILRESRITLPSHGLLQDGCSFASPALRGARLTWKTQGHNHNLVCVDERGLALARFEFNAWSFKECGKLEFFAASDGGVAEEILLTGLALMECMLGLRYTYTPL